MLGSHLFGVAFSRLHTFFGIIWVLPINYSLYEKLIRGIIVYLFISKVSKKKVNFRFFINSSFKVQKVLFPKELQKMPVLFFSSSITLYNENKFNGEIM